MLGPSGGSTIPPWVLPGAVIDMDFTTPQYFGCTPATCLSLTRASNATDLLPASASGYAYNTYANNVLAISPNVGLLSFEARTNQLLNSAAPATQTTASLGTGVYTLWVNGSGSAQMALGTGVGCGTGTATNGTPVNFTITVAGTCIVTVVGSLNFFQLELGAFGTSGIVTAGTAASRAADAITTIGNIGNSFYTTNVGSVVVSSGGIPTGMVTGTSEFIFLNFNMSLYWSGGGAVGSKDTSGGNFIGATFGSGSPFSPFKAGLSWSAAGRSIVSNNGTVATVASNLVLATVTFNLLMNAQNGALKRITFWNSKIADTTLKALTQ